MTDPVPTVRARPGVVTAASGLLLLVAAVQLVSAVLLIVQFPIVTDTIEDQFSGDPAIEPVRVVTQIGLYFGMAVAFVLLVLYAVLAVFVRRGSQPARVTTWVFSGLGVLCTGCGLAGTALGGVAGRFQQGDAEAADLQRRVADALPSWIGPSSMAVNLVTLLALVLAIVLLALPAANDYFRKNQPIA